MPRSRQELSTKQRKFVAEYAKDGNGYQAALRAGYSKSSARSQASDLLTRPHILAALKTRLDKAELTADRVLEELRRMAFANMADYMRVGPNGVSGLDLSQLTREQAAAIQEVIEDTTGGAGDGERRLVLRTRLKLGSKLQALELLGKYFKLYADRVEHSGPGGGPIPAVIQVEFVKPEV